MKVSHREPVRYGLSIGVGVFVIGFLMSNSAAAEVIFEVVMMTAGIMITIVCLITILVALYTD